MSSSNKFLPPAALPLMRLLADVAAEKTNPAAQLVGLIDGLQSIFGAKLAWFYAVDGWKPGLQPSLTHQVISSDARPEWLHYLADFSVKNPPSADPWADAALHCDDPRQVWRRGQVLPDEAAHHKYQACSDMIKYLRVGDGMVCAYRPDEKPDRVVGFAVHRDEAVEWFNEQDVALARLALDEIADLDSRGHLNLRPATTPELPPRLDQVLDRVLTGKAPKEIAKELNLSLFTVREHIQRLYKHYAVQTRQELMSKFVK